MQKTGSRFFKVVSDKYIYFCVRMFWLRFSIATEVFVGVLWVLRNSMPSSYWSLWDERCSSFVILIQNFWNWQMFRISFQLKKDVFFPFLKKKISWPYVHDVIFLWNSKNRLKNHWLWKSLPEVTNPDVHFFKTPDCASFWYKVTGGKSKSMSVVWL